MLVLIDQTIITIGSESNVMLDPPRMPIILSFTLFRTKNDVTVVLTSVFSNRLTNTRKSSYTFHLNATTTVSWAITTVVNTRRMVSRLFCGMVY